MKKFRLSPVSVALTAVAAVSLVLNIVGALAMAHELGMSYEELHPQVRKLQSVGAFVLPSQLRTHISLSGAAVDTMNKFLYLPFSTFLICVSSVTGLYLKDKRVRYLIVASILCLMNIAVFVVNMMK